MGEVVYRQGQGLVETEDPAPPSAPLLHIRDWGLFDYKNNRFRLVVDDGVDAAQLPQEFWVPVASQLHPFDRIDVLTRDGARFVEILVVQVSMNGVDTIPLRAVDIPKFAPRSEQDLPPGFEIRQEAISGQWQAYRNGEKMGESHGRKEVVRQYIVTHSSVKQPTRAHWAAT